MIIYLQTIEDPEDRAKFELLYEHYRSYMLKIANKILENEFDAEDAVRNAFVSISEHMEKVYDPLSHTTKGYVTIIVERKAIDIYRMRRRFVSLESIENEIGLSFPPPEDDDVAKCISKLPARYRHVIMLKYHHGYNVKEISDERLREAARKAEESLLASLPEPEECEATFSPEFERKMEKLIRRTKHPVRHRIMKAVACFLLVVLVGAGSVLTFSMEARAAFVSWVKEVYETQIIYRFFQNSEETSDSVIYQPTWVPSGYKLTLESVSDGPSTIEYRDDSDNRIVFTYFQNTSALVFQIEQDSTDIYKQVSVNGITAELYLDQDEGNTNVLIWTDEGSDTVFRILAPFGEVELIEMAESVERRES